MDSNSEDSDSEMSGREVDSDVENEKQISYDRSVYKEDLKVKCLRIRILFTNKMLMLVACTFA